MKNTLMKMKRGLCLLLCAVLVLSNITILTGAVGEDGTLVDPHTLDQWQNYFGVQTNDPNDVSLTTEYAGGVWTDKSVFDPDTVPSQLTDAKYNGNSFALTDKGDNFLVALSAMASNKQIKGYSTLPTDTVLILDLSSSMRYTDDNQQSAVDELVEATNKAIDDLLMLNKNNRVAVVVYAGNTAKSFSANNGITQITLPLDSYTTDKAGTYLVIDPETVEQWVQTRPGRGEWQEVPNTNPYGLAVYGGVKNSSNQAVANDFEVSTGTFMQDGIYEAMKLLKAADPVVREGVQIGTSRLPIVVLMTDGEPTLANPDYNGNDNRTDLGNSTMYNYDGNTGNVGGYSYGHRDSIAFMTSLTAAFAKKELAAHYGTDPLLYTLPYGSTVMNRSEALSVMNPVNASAVQNELWNRFLAGEEVTVYSYNEGGRTRYYTVENSSVAAERLSAADRYYVDRYFPANNDDEMLKAFEDIVNEIILQSKYYPTYVEGNTNHDGYLTFVDKIGEEMEVSDVKGIVIGDRLFSGAALAEIVSGSNLDQLGDNLVQSVKQRLGVEDTLTAELILKNAKENGQLAYTSDAEFSHYIGWYSDNTGKYVDFWHEGIQTAVPANATHIIKSYGFLGDTTVVPGVSNTDMMYMTVRVATEIATGESIVTWRIPASLIPTTTYEVEVEVDSDGVIQRVLALNLENNTANSPIRLLYEVEMRRDVEDWNLAEKMHEAGYTMKDANGNYVFYSNKWEASASETDRNTYSHFEPSEKNERYYYTQDTTVLYKDGEAYKPYTGAKPTGTGYYRAYEVFEKLENGTLRTHIHHEAISAEALASAEAFGTEWVIPKGTVHRYYDYERTGKIGQTTDTMGYSDYPFIVKEGDVYYTYSTQGNNGKLTLTPATGIKLSKKLEAGYTGTQDYTFKITGAIANAQVVRLDAEGIEVSRSALANDGTLTLKAGETVYIVGLTAGTYTVEEQIPANADYKVTAVTVAGQLVSGTEADVTLADKSITEVEFTNGEKGNGSLIVSKDVNYPDGFAPTAAHNGKEFTVNVTFTGNLDGMIAPAGATKNGNVYTLNLRDGESATFTEIREGVTYTVEEVSLSAGYSLKRIQYTDTTQAITGGDADQAHVVNDYKPTSVAPNVKVRGTKTVKSNDPWPTGATFTVRLLEVTDFSSGKELTDTVTETDRSYEIDMSSLTFDKVGTYYFRVVEEIPDNRIPDMAYDRTYGLFSIVVTDENADGALEIKAVQAYQNTGISGDNTNGWVITKDFTNVVTKDRVYLKIEKTIVDKGDPTKFYPEHSADITFGLFENRTDTTPVYYGITDGNGKVTMMIPVTKAELGTTGKAYYLREIAPEVEDRVVGMDYNEEWLYKITITWDDTNANAKAVVHYEDLINQTGEQIQDADTVYSHTNTYTTKDAVTEPITLSGEKTLNGQTDLGGREFEFELYNSTAAFVVQENVVQTVQNNGNTISFTRNFDKPGMHYMVIKEKATQLGGVTIDPVEYHVTVLVEKYSDNGVTKLRVANGYPLVVKYGTSVPLQPNELNFNNRYNVTGSTSVTIDGSKVLNGRPMVNGEFDFLLKEINADGTEKQDGLVLESENGPADHTNQASFAFAPISYTEVGTHYYLITEKNGGAKLDGVDYSAESYRVKVEVTDNGAGGLDSAWSIVRYNDATANLPAKITFTNAYTSKPAELSIQGKKDLLGRDLADGEFTFRLTEMDSTFATAVGTPIEKTNDIHGIIDFGTFSYAGIGEHYYLVEEVIPATPAGGMTYDHSKFHITVEVSDDHKGSLTATVASILEITEDRTRITLPVSSISFDNHYNAEDATLPLGGTKELTGREIVDSEFTFELYEGETLKQSVSNVGKTFTFADLTFDAEGTYTYTVKEKKGDAVGVTYDETVYTVVVTVVDENGQLKATKKVDNEADKAIVFNNHYDATDATVSLGGTKELTGREIVDGEFTFELYEGETLKQSVSNVGKTFTFADLTFDRAGTYTYTVEEKKGNAAGITYDEKVYTVVVTVVDENGQLKATKTVDGKADTALAFVNKYDPIDAKMGFGGTKTLLGRDIKDGEFFFELYLGEELLEIVPNVGNAVTFRERIFDTAGEYTFTVKEKKGEDATITYDEKVYTVTVTVVDLNGVLTATKLVDGKADTAIVFTNTYTNPEEPPAEQPPAEDEPPVEQPPAEQPPAENDKPVDSDNPDTGDHTHLQLWIALLVISGGLFGALILLKKKMA